MAKIEAFDGGNIVHTYAQDIDLSSYRTATLTCEHCCTNRNRNFYYVVAGPDGMKMVGRNCLANYIGTQDAEAIADFYANVAEADFEDEDGEDEGFARSEHFYKLSEFMAVVCMNVRLFGFVSKKNEDYDQRRFSTISRVWDFYCEEEKGNSKPQAEDYTMANTIIKEVVDYLNAKRNLTEYDYTLLTLLQAEHIKYNHGGYVASAYAVYAMLMATERTAKDTKASEWIGNVGDKKVVFSGTVENINGTSTNFGWMNIYTFDCDGNKVVYFSSSDWDISIDKPVTFIATIKGHTTFNGVKQTVITRGKLL